MIEENSVRKSVLHYAKCQNGDLHQGQILNLVCVDASCKRRGLICPVCRIQSHESHQILPVKVFLDQIKQIFVNTGQKDQLNNLSDYLRSLQTSRKQLLSTLRQSALSIAQSFQTLQQSINTNYASIRKSILAQSTISTKLPNLVSLLTQAKQKDPLQLKIQFQKYTQLLKYQNDRFTVADKSKKLVQEYAKVSSTLKEQCDNKIKDIKKTLSSLSVSLNQQEVKSTKIQKYTFSKTNKASTITVNQAGNKAQGQSQNYDPRIIFVQQGKGQLQQKCTFQITQNYSDMIHLGIGIVQDFKPKNFNYDYLQKMPTHTFALCTGKIDDNNYGSQDSYVQNAGFNYNAGDKIQVKYSSKQNTITFSKLNTEQKDVQSLSYTDEQKKKLQFVIGVGSGDIITIVDNNK